MFKAVLLIIIPLTILSCKSKNQNEIDKIKAELIFEETPPLFKQFLELQTRNEDSARLISEQLITKYEEVHRLDTTNKDAESYLADFYKYDRQYSKALYLNLKLLKLDTLERAIAGYSEAAAFCYINLGQLDSAKYFLEKSLAISEKDKTLFDIQMTVSAFKRNTENIYRQTDTGQVTLLKSKNIDPCNYSIQLFNYFLPVAEKHLDKMKVRARYVILRMLNYKNCLVISVWPLIICVTATSRNTSFLPTRSKPFCWSTLILNG